uniref:ATP synthase F0 subunit 8 n=1 Tax=Plectus sambesii TaxID=2011161 RepID=A0A914XDG4_9BILA
MISYSQVILLYVTAFILLYVLPPITIFQQRLLSYFVGYQAKCIPNTILQFRNVSCFVLYTFDLMKPQRKKSHDEKSRDRDGQSIVSDLRPI